MTQTITVAVELDVLFSEMPKRKQKQFIMSHMDVLRAKDLAPIVEKFGLKLTEYD